MAGNYSVGLSPMDTAMVMQAMQTPTPYGAYPMYTAPADKTYVAQPKLIDTTLTAPATETEEKSSSFGTVGVIGTVGAAALCVAGFKKGNPNKKMFSRVCDGIGNMAKGLFKGKAAQETSTIRQNNGKTVVTLPGRKNVMLEEKGLNEIGASKPATDGLIKGTEKYPGQLAKGCELHRFYDVVKVGKAEYRVIGTKDGYIVLKGGKNVTEELKNNARTQIEKHVNAIKNGEVDLTTLRSAFIRQTDSAGNIHQFKLAGETCTHTFSASNYFPLEHDRVAQQCLHNDGFKNVIEKAKAGKFNELKIGNGSTVKLPGISGVKECTVDKNGNVLSITLSTVGKDRKNIVLTPGTPQCDKILLQQKEAIDKAINATDKSGKKINWSNVIYEAKAA